MSPTTLAPSARLAALALAACAATPSADVAAPRTLPAAVSASNSDAGVEQSVTGHYEYEGSVTGNYFKYSVSAIRHADGSVSGEVEERLTVAATGDFVRRSHGAVTCLTVVGNRARIGYMLDQYEGDPVLPPDRTHGIITVVDNGEGANAIAPDSAANNPGGVTAERAQLFCDVGFDRPMRAVEHGNIQVRAGDGT
jgi:hypothetical protein